MTELSAKKAVASAALDYIEDNEILGLGTGSTVDCLIALLPNIKSKIKGIVSSSIRTSTQIEQLGIPLLELANVTHFTVYIDGADEVNPNLEMIKGGGGALTREKIVAAHADRFICIVSAEKQVEILGAFPLPVEVIPMATHYVMRELDKLGGTSIIREGFITDNGNQIIDIHGLSITNPRDLESQINQITGVVTNGIFAHRKADLLLVATPSGSIKTIIK